MRKGAESIIGVLKKGGVRTVFGIPSIHNIGMYEALREENSISHYLCRNEASATHMADGYARATHGIGVVLTSTGPGAAYAGPALQEAFGSSSPVLMITTNIPSEKIGKGLGVLHEVEDQESLFRPFTKAQICIRTVHEVETCTEKAMAIALSGRPGPVYLEVPTDLLDQEIPERKGRGGFEPEGFQEGRADLDRAVSLLIEARQPFILAGTSALRAGIGEEIAALAERLFAPVVTVTQAKGILPEDHPLAFGNAARKGKVREMVEACDVALAIGTRLREVDAKRRGLLLPRLIHVDWDGQWIGRNFPTEVGLPGDIRTTVRTLLDRIPLGLSVEERRHRILEMRKGLEEEIARLRKERIEVDYVGRLREALPREGILVIDNTQIGYWAEYFFPSYRPGGLIGAKGSSIIGFAFPAAVGAKIARPETPIVAVTGDGGFLYGAQELATCRRHGIGFPVIVVNDGAYGVIGYLQRLSFGREHESWLENPDFVQLANAFGTHAVRVDSPEALAAAVETALSSQQMWLIELVATFPEPPFGRY